MISHDYKLFFVHIPKCAGRSVCDMFQQRFDHFTARYLAKEYAGFWNDYHKFTIIRNPYERLVSLYEYIKAHRRHSLERIAICEGNIPTFSQWLKINIQNYQGDFPWPSPEGHRGTDGDLGSAFWFSSMKRRLADSNGNIIVTNIFRLEDGIKPIEEFLTTITGIKAALPHCNKSEFEDYQSYYNSETLHWAENFAPIIEDCEAFGYKF